jgi:hypothetical protein
MASTGPVSWVFTRRDDLREGAREIWSIAWWLHESELVNVRSTAFVLIDVAAGITLNESLKPS